MILGFSHTVQLWILAKAIGTGYFLGFIFSIFMLFNAAGGKWPVTVFLRDVLFFVITAFISFMFMLKYCSGMLRFYALAGELMGFFLFYIFPASSVAAGLRKICEGLRKGRHKSRKKMKKNEKNT